MLLQVVLAVARVFYYLAPETELPKIVPPLLRLLHVSPEVERIVLANLVITLSALSVSVVFSLLSSSHIILSTAGCPCEVIYSFFSQGR